MLFLMNDQITEIEIPEMHLAKRWQSLGCGDPYGMRAREALNFASRVVGEHLTETILASLRDRHQREGKSLDVREIWPSAA